MWPACFETPGERRCGVDDRSEALGNHCVEGTADRATPRCCLGARPLMQAWVRALGVALTAASLPLRFAHQRTPPQRAERLELCDLFLERGENAATLCEGWDAAISPPTFRKRAQAGCGSRPCRPPLAKHLDRVMEQTRSAHELRGPGRQGPSGPPVDWRPFDRLVNLNEYFVHHEDLRRGERRQHAESRPTRWRTWKKAVARLNRSPV